MELTRRIDRLEDALERLAEALAVGQAQLLEAQARAEARVADLAAAQIQLAEAQTRTEARVEQFAAGLSDLAAAQAGFAAAQTRLAEAQARTEAELGQLTAAQAQLTAAQARTEQQLGELLAWQKGTDGRLKGERYERTILRRAYVLLQGGDGGTAEELPIRRRLTELLMPHVGPDLPAYEDPALSDLLWWKGERVAVVEVSNVVDDDDVERAHLRAETLRRAGVPATGVVIGEAWADGQTRAGAEALRVEWKVGSELSDGFIAFRRLPAAG